jgi:hypothetical protein
VDRLT